MARKNPPKRTGYNILVVDDQDEILSSVETLLDRHGHTPIVANSGETALAILKSQEIHVILVDYFMPRMSGEELIRGIRCFDPYVQIILQTGYSGEKPAHQMMAELEIQGYHDKTDGPEKLLLWIDVAVKAHKLVAELCERERIQSELVANVSHEFRTPLNIIGGYTDLLLDGEFGCLPTAASDALRRLACASNDLSCLVTDLLTYAKVEWGNLDREEKHADEQWVESESVTDEMQRLASLLLDHREIGFNTETSNAPARFRIDGPKLRLVLRNLVANAIKFTERGTVSLTIEADADEIRFIVADTGPGIAREDTDIVFEPFRQLNGSSTREHGGIGLGLALSKKLARILGGDIHLDTEVGVGSRFTVALRGIETADHVEPAAERGCSTDGITVHSE